MLFGKYSLLILQGIIISLQNTIILMIRINLILLTILAIATYPANATNNVWNQLVSFEGMLQPQDQSTEQSQVSRSYVLKLLSNDRFSFVILSQTGETELAFQGTSIPKAQNMSLHSYGYLLQSESLTPMKGSLSYQTGWGVTWNYNIQINQMRVSLARTEVRYQYLFILVAVLFGVSSVMIFSVSEKNQGKIIYNLKVRTHPFVLMGIILKIFWTGACFVIPAYESIFQLPIWVLPIVFGIYFFCFAPSMIHLLFLCSATQRNIVESQYYQSKSKEARIGVILGASLILILIFMVSLAIGKGILFYYLITINNLFIYGYSWKSKKFAYGPLIIYDILLTLTLSLFSLFYPVQYFSIATYKQMLLFWNVYAFLILFGMIFMKKLIRSEIVEQIQLREYSLDSAQIQRQTKGTRQPQSAQIIQE